jgi:hypothetical protein
VRWTLVLSLWSAAACAQELEPRAYSNGPVGMNFAIGAYTRFSGPVLLDPSIPVTDLDARINAYSLAYARFLELFGRSANVSIAVPYVSADLKGRVVDDAAEVHRAGFGDLRVRAAINLFGHGALTPGEFARREEALAAGVSLSVIAPTGQYVPTRFINIGTNRWAFKPEAGVSYPIGDWFTEAAVGVWLFTDNDDFQQSHRRSQNLLAVYQLHTGYTFRPGLWIAVDYGMYVGGRTALDGVENDDAQRNARAGVAFSLPLSRSWSSKLAYSKGTSVRIGGDFSTLSLAVQYRWFD